MFTQCVREEEGVKGGRRRRSLREDFSALSALLRSSSGVVWRGMAWYIVVYNGAVLLCCCVVVLV